MTTVNEKLKEAFNPFSWWSIGDAVAGVVSGWLWEDLGGEGVGVKRGVRECERWVEGWNREREGKGDGEEGGMVRCWGVRRTGLLSVSFPRLIVVVVFSGAWRVGGKWLIEWAARYPDTGSADQSS